MASGDGLIVNMSSVAGQTGLGSNVAYCASKAALDSMTRSLARALAPTVRVVSVSPGWVEGEYAQRMNLALLEEQRQKTPLKKLARADDVAEVCWRWRCTCGTRLAASFRWMAGDRSAPNETPST